MAIRPIPIPDSSLIVRRLATWRAVLCCAPSYLAGRPAPRQPSDLASHNCLRYAFYPFEDGWHFIGPDGVPVSVPVTGNLQTSSAEMLRTAALDGLGLFLAPGFVLGDELETGRLVPVMADYRPVEFAINAVYPHRHHLSAKVRSFIDLLALRIAARGQALDHPSQG